MEDRTYAGHVYRRSAPGEAWQLVGPAQTAPSGGPNIRVLGAPDPFRAKADARADHALDISAGGLAVTQANSEREARQQGALLPGEVRKTNAEALKAEAEAEKARRDLTAQQSTATPEQQQGMAALADDEIIAALDKARSDIGRTGSAGFAARLPEAVQPQSAIDLAGSLATISSRITLDTLAKLKQMSPTGASGLGSLTEREGMLLRDSVAGLGQTQSPERLLENLAAVEKHYRNAKALMDGKDYRDPSVAEHYGIARMPETSPALSLATGGTRSENDPVLRGVNGHIRGMIGANHSADEIVGYLNSVRPGLGDGLAGKVKAATQFRSQNPNVPLDRYPIEVESRQVPMSSTRQAVNSLAQSPLGAYGMAATDAITAGTIDNMAPDPALARAGMAAVRNENPWSSAAGMVSGGVLAGAGTEAAATGLVGARAAPTVADLLYGAAYGAGSADEGNRFEGAGWGAASSLIGGQVGRRAAKGVAEALIGASTPDAALLRERDIPLTIGQILGGGAKAREDRLAGFSGVGDQIIARRKQGLEAFNRAAFNEGMAPIGAAPIHEVGERAVERAQDATSAAYDKALSGVNVGIDFPFLREVSPHITAGREIPNLGDQFGYTIDKALVNNVGPRWRMDGDAIQAQLQGLQRDAVGFAHEPRGSEFGDAARGVVQGIENLVERQAPDGIMPLKAANEAYRNKAVLEDATLRAINTEGVFTPAQLGISSRANTIKFGGKGAAARGDRPFYELQRAAQEVLPSKVPDSGTAGRAEANGGLTATGRTIARNLLNGPLYAEGTQDIIARLLMDRSPAMVRAGELISGDKTQSVAGLLARPAALGYGPLSVTEGY